MKRSMKKIVAVGLSVFLAFSMTVNSWAGWEEIEVEGVSGNWQYRNDDGKLEKDKWLFDSGKWYYLGSDGVMLKNKWLKDEYGKGIAWFGADGGLCNLSSPVEYGGPGIEINKYLTDSGEGEKVKLNMDYLTDLTPEERRLFDFIIENYKMDEKTDTEYKQNLYIAISADELGKLLGLEVVEYDDKKCVYYGDVLDAVNNINIAVMKETRNELILWNESKVIGGINQLCPYVTLTLNNYAVSRIVNIRDLNGLINNTLVRVLNIEDGTTSQIEAAKRIYEWLCNEFNYNLDKMESDLFTCWVMREGICWSFAGLYKKMCNMCGIECGVESGANYWNKNEAGHAWNVITINGLQNFVDVTWGIAIKRAGGDRDKILKFFNMDRVELSETHAKYIFVK